MSPVRHWRTTQKLKENLNKKGKVITWTKIHVAPEGFEDQTPYYVALVELENKIKLPFQLVDATEQQIKPGLKVMTVIRKGKKVSESEVIEYTLKVKPL